MEELDKELMESIRKDNRVGQEATIKAYKSTIEAQAAEITELKDEVENLNDELIFRPKYSTLTEHIAGLKADKLDADTNAQEWEVENKELRKAIQAIDDIVYEECDAEWIKQIWSIVEGIKEVK